MKNFLTVKEFSRLSGIERTTLRYWDEIGLFSPARRDPKNNYRYYSSEQIVTVNFINVLSELNIPLKTIGEMAGKRTPENIVRLIEQREKKLDLEMRRLRESYSIIHTRLELIRYGIRLEMDGGIDAGEAMISVQSRDEEAYVLGPLCEFKDGEEFYEPLMRFCRAAPELRINLHYPIGGYHDSMAQFCDAPDKPDRFFSLDPTGNRIRPAGKFLVGYIRGYYGELGDLPERMNAFSEKNGLALSGPVYTMYLYDEVCMEDPSQYLAQISVAVSR